MPHPTEVRIPVPWGHIAGKWWGPTDQRPILTIHGWQENCRSFDLLIPELPQDVSYLAIDAVGHGLSSKLPPGIHYNSLNQVIVIKMIKNYFKWEKISLMGHSLGAISCYMYGFLFPSTVDFMICIDGFHTLINRNVTDKLVKYIEEFLRFDAQNSNSNEPPSYTLEEIAVRLRASLRNSIDADKVEYILERNVKPSKESPGKLYFSRDARVKCENLFMWPKEEVLEAAGRVTFPLFVSRSESKTLSYRKEDCYEEICGVLRKSPGFEFHEIRGTHHEHLNNPKVYANIISNFINKFNYQSRDQVHVIDAIKAKL